MSTPPNEFTTGESTNAPRRQLHELLNAALTDELTTEQLAHAEALLRDDPAALEGYLAPANSRPICTFTCGPNRLRSACWG